MGLCGITARFLFLVRQWPLAEHVKIKWKTVPGTDDMIQHFERFFINPSRWKQKSSYNKVMAARNTFER